MLPVISRFFIGLITSVAGFIVLKNILKSEEKLFCIKNITLVLLSTLPTVLFYRSEYMITLSILTYFFQTIMYKAIFRLNTIQAFFSTGILMIIISLSDVITSMAFINFTTVEKMRSYFSLMIASNFCVAIIAIMISKIRIISDKIMSLLNRMELKKNVNTVLFVIVIVLVICTLFYNVSETFTLSSDYILNISIMAIFFILVFVFLREQYNYDKLNHDYETLFEYVENFEDWIEREQLNRHELKNNLGALRNITKNKKIIEKIDDILNDNIRVEEKWIEELKYVPKGVLKGLFYYKMAIAKKKKVTVITETTPSITKCFKKLDKTELKELTQLVGIYIDNAIEAAELSKKKKICIEIYTMDKKLNLVISNSYKDKVDLGQINKKGHSTKGKGRGNGLYFAKKILDKSDVFCGEQRIIGDYFTSKIIIQK